MLLIEVGYKDERICNLHISNHASPKNSTDTNYKLVCAGVSSITIGMCNAIDLMCKDSCSIDINYSHDYLNHVKVSVANNSEKLQTILNTALIQLKTIDESYKGYIKIENMEV